MCVVCVCGVCVCVVCVCVCVWCERSSEWVEWGEGRAGVGLFTRERERELYRESREEIERERGET